MAQILHNAPTFGYLAQPSLQSLDPSSATTRFPLPPRSSTDKSPLPAPLVGVRTILARLCRIIRPDMHVEWDTSGCAQMVWAVTALIDGNGERH